MLPATHSSAVEAAPVPSAPVLELRGFGVAFLDTLALAEVTFDVPARGMVVLVGPPGAGKSTLLRTLAGLNDAQPSLRTWGRALMAGRELGDGHRPMLVQQKVRLLASSLRENLASSLPDRSRLTRLQQVAMMAAALEAHGMGHLVDHLDHPVDRLDLGTQRRVSIVRALFSDPAVLMVDEPTAGVDDAEEAARLVDLLAAESAHRAIMLVTHHPRDARRAGGLTVLLAGGRVQEIAPTTTFWSTPATEAARAFVESGHCLVPSPMARPEELADGIAPPPPLPAGALAATTQPPATRDGPRGFFWLQRGRLGGMARPGMIGELSADLDALVALGVRTLVTLEEQVLLDVAAVRSAGLVHMHFPIQDMRAPHPDTALAFLKLMSAQLARGECVVMHCRAGMGRTGTMLAAMLVLEGASAVEAVERARRINPRWIQSDEQLQFLVDLEERLGPGRHYPGVPT